MLKSIVAAAALAVLVSPTTQAVEFVNENGSQYSQICIAAAQSPEALKREATAQGLNSFQIKEITCNGLSLKSFAKKYRQNNSEETVKVVAFENANKTDVTELCIAAATSNDAFSDAKARLFNNEDVNVRCNGQELVKFAKRFNKQFNG